MKEGTIEKLGEVGAGPHDVLPEMSMSTQVARVMRRIWGEEGRERVVTLHPADAPTLYAILATFETTAPTDPMSNLWACLEWLRREGAYKTTLRFDLSRGVVMRVAEGGV